MRTGDEALTVAAPSRVPPEARLDDCPEEGRRVFYTRVGRFFTTELPLPLPPGAVSGCGICGKVLTHGRVSSKKPFCAPQRSITEKRLPCVAKREKVPKLLKGGTVAPPRGSEAFNDLRKAVLITPSRSLVIVNVRPAGDLPPDMTMFHEGSGKNMAELYRAALMEPLETPALFVMFQRAANAPFVMTTSPDLVVECGGPDPVEIDVHRVRAFMRMAEVLGADRFRTLVESKGKVVDGTATDADRSAYVAVLADLPPAMRPLVPHPTDPVLGPVRTMLANPPQENRP